MGFMDSYKHLEKLCGEVMNDERRVSAYIDEMSRLTQGPSLVRGWNDDLRNLKHYRWVRNQIVHEPDCTEESMCSPEDIRWLDDFYDRIMEQTDPLTLYRKAMQARFPEARHKPVPQTYAYQTHRNTTLRKKPVGCTGFLLGILGILVLLFI